MTICTDCPLLVDEGYSYYCGLRYDVDSCSIHPKSHNCRLIKVETVDSAFYPDRRGEYEEDEE